MKDANWAEWRESESHPSGCNSQVFSKWWPISERILWIFPIINIPNYQNTRGIVNLLITFVMKDIPYVGSILFVCWASFVVAIVVLRFCTANKEAHFHRIWYMLAFQHRQTVFFTETTVSNYTSFRYPSLHSLRNYTRLWSCLFQLFIFFPLLSSLLSNLN